MPDTGTTTRTFVVVDRGPVGAAVVHIATFSTLAEHVVILDGGTPIEVEVTDDIPFELWGSGTQALWRLVCAIAYSGESVSLYEVAARLDQRNTAVVADALGMLFGGAR